MKVEITLQFDVPDNYDLDIVTKILRERIINFDYYNELVQYTFITKPERSIIYKNERLEHLERAISAFNELLEPKSSDRSTEAEHLLAEHHIKARELKNAQKNYPEMEKLYHELNQLKWIGSDEGWDLAITKVREEIAKKLKENNK